MNAQPMLLTGSGGFLGSRLNLALDGPVLCPRRTELDLLDERAVADYLKQHAPTTIIHCAGYVGGVGLNKEHPGRMITDNLRMGLNLLEHAARQGDMHVCVVSTACVFANDAPFPTPEMCIHDGDPTGDTAFYGIAKRTLLTVCEGLHREFGLTYSYVIPTNFYGPGDYFDPTRSTVIPALIRRAFEAKETKAPHLVVWGDGSQTRDLLYVDDMVRGIIATLKPEAKNDVFNIGSGRETSVRELVALICETVGYQGEIVYDVTKPGGSPRRALDGTKARQRLGFEPRVGLAQGLAATYRWYLENRRS